MNRGQLNPPKRVFQGVAVFLVAPAVLCCACWLRMNELQRMYFWSFVNVSSVPSGEGWFSHKVKPHPRTIYCADRDAPVITGMVAEEVHPVVFPMTTPAYRAWLERFIYRGKLWPFVKRPVVLAMLCLVPVFLGAWKVDRLRHLKFRSTPRHLRGSQLITRSQFRKKVQGSGIGWRTEDFTEEI